MHQSPGAVRCPCPIAAQSVISVRSASTGAAATPGRARALRVEGAQTQPRGGRGQTPGLGPAHQFRDVDLAHAEPHHGGHVGVDSVRAGVADGECGRDQLTLQRREVAPRHEGTRSVPVRLEHGGRVAHAPPDVRHAGGAEDPGRGGARPRRSPSLRPRRRRGRPTESSSAGRDRSPGFGIRARPRPIRGLRPQGRARPLSNALHVATRNGTA